VFHNIFNQKKLKIQGLPSIFNFGSANLPPFKKRQKGKNGKFALLVKKPKRQKWHICLLLRKGKKAKMANCLPLRKGKKAKMANCLPLR